MRNTAESRSENLQRAQALLNISADRATKIDEYAEKVGRAIDPTYVIQGDENDQGIEYEILDRDDFHVQERLEDNEVVVSGQSTFEFDEKEVGIENSILGTPAKNQDKVSDSLESPEELEDYSDLPPTDLSREIYEPGMVNLEIPEGYGVDLSAVVGVYDTIDEAEIAHEFSKDIGQVDLDKVRRLAENVSDQKVIRVEQDSQKINDMEYKINSLEEIESVEKILEKKGGINESLKDLWER
ncbi:hypothetical protein GLU60_02745 [Nanohaloarchaea archaeon H01]|nr:hypothetical protein [Nanohaloarchaea archaeon H01]